MKYLLSVLFFTHALFAMGQPVASRSHGGKILGRVADKMDETPVQGASVRILQKADSVYVKGTITDEKGHFDTQVPLGDYIVQIVFIGYRSASYEGRASKEHPHIDLGKILLSENSVELSEAEVVAQIPPMVVKGDTIEYNASAYQGQTNAMLQDLVKNIPGMEIDANGNISANGKPVQKILVDGKEFFGNDIALALSNLPASMVKKLQLFKQQSDEAKVTGMKDKDPPQVLNLVVKEELRRSLFGELRSGYGTDGRYSHKGIANYMQGDNQYSTVGEVSNVSNSDYMASGSDGIDAVKNVGVNMFVQNKEKMKFGGNVRYGNNNNLFESQTNTQTFLPTGDRFSRQNLSTTNDRKNLAAGFNLQWQPDSLTNIYANSHARVSNTTNRQHSDNISFLAQQDTTSGFADIKNEINGYNVNSALTIGRTFGKKGRVASLSLTHRLNNDRGNGTNYSQTSYADATPDKVIDQQTSTTNNNASYGVSASYVEPLGKQHSLQLSYGYNRNNTDRNRIALRKDNVGNYTVVDTAFTRRTENKFESQDIGINVQGNGEKLNYNVGVNINPSLSRSIVSLGDSIIETTRQQVVNYAPSIYLSYNPKNSTGIDLSYSGSTSQATRSQLSADTVIVSALSKSYGNPDLKPGFTHNMSIYFRKSDYETSRFLMLSAYMSYMVNNIVNYTLVDAVGNSVNTYRNVTGDMNANINLMYDTPLRNKKWSINNSSTLSYNKNLGFSNGDLSVSHNTGIGQQTRLKFKSKQVESGLQAAVNFNIVRNSLTNIQDRNTSTYKLEHTAVLNLPFDLSIKNFVRFTYFRGFEENFKNKEILWNTTISKQILRQKKGTIMVQIFDILNDRNNLSRTINGNYLSDTRTNVISRYAMLSFSYRFNVMKGQKRENVETDGDI